MRDADKTPAQDATVQGKDSPCAVRERARIRAMVQPLLDEWLAAYGEPALQAYDAGRVHALRDVLDILDGKDVSHE